MSPRKRHPLWIVAALLLVLTSSLLTVKSNAFSHTASSKSIVPQESISRARQWVAAGVPYNRDGAFQAYREDCSGLVSMAWGLPAPGFWTGNEPNNPNQQDSLSSVAILLGKALDDNSQPVVATTNELQPGDVLMNQTTDLHVILFVGWVDKAAKKLVDKPVVAADGKLYYDGIEENGDYGAVEHTPDKPWPYPYYDGYGSAYYYAWRLNPTLTPQPSGTAKSNPYPPFTGTLVLNDPLNRDDGQWQSGNGFCEFQNGEYVLTALKDDGGSAECPYNRNVAPDFAFQVTMTSFLQVPGVPIQPSEDGSTGIFFSNPDIGSLGYFRFFITKHGELSLEYYKPNYGWDGLTRIISFPKGPIILAVVVIGSNVTAYVNLVKELTVTIPDLGAGQISLETDWSENDWRVSAAFQSAKLWIG